MRLRTRFAGGAPAVAVLALGLSGCGSHAATRAQVIVRADAICSGTLRSVRAAETAGVQVSSLVPLIAREVRGLTALPRPAPERALLAGYLSAMRTELGQWRALGAAQAGGSSSRTTQALLALSHNPAPKLAARYGMRDCAAAGATVGSGRPGAVTSSG